MPSSSSLIGYQAVSHLYTIYEIIQHVPHHISLSLITPFAWRWPSSPAIFCPTLRYINMARAPCKEEICRHLCHHASYQEDIDNLVVQAKAEPASGSVLLTWPPTAGGEGFSAFMTKIDTGGELANALIVVFRGTHSPGEWARYPGGFFRGPSEMDGLSVFPPWVKTLEQVSLRMLS